MKSTSHYYKEVISLVTQDLDWKAIALDYAKQHPSDFYRVATTQVGPKWMLNAIQAPSLGDCVRIRRNNTGESIKEAKEWAEKHWIRS